MKPIFKIDKNDRHYVTEKYLTNGHWLVTREMAKDMKAFKPLNDLRTGCYEKKLIFNPDIKTPDCERIIPKKSEKMQRLSESPVGVQFGFSIDPDEISHYIFESLPGTGQVTFRIGVDPKYVDFLRLGACFAEDGLSPIRIEDGNGDFVAVVMPKRLSK